LRILAPGNLDLDLLSLSQAKVPLLSQTVQIIREKKRVRIRRFPGLRAEAAEVNVNNCKLFIKYLRLVMEVLRSCSID
jgi:hypothetical protein